MKYWMAGFLAALVWAQNPKANAPKAPELIVI